MPATVLPGVPDPDASPVLHRSRGRRLLPALLLVAALCACSAGGGGSPAETSSLAPSVATAAPLSFAALPSPLATPAGSPTAVGNVTDGALAPGWWSYAAFVPRVVLQLPAGWEGGHRIDEFWDVLQHPGSDAAVAIAFGRPIAVHSGIIRADPVETSEAAVAALAGNRSVELTNPRLVAIGGLTGRSVDLRSRLSAQLPVFDGRSGTYHLGAGRMLRLAFLDSPDGLLTVGVEAPLPAFEGVLREVAPILASLRIGG